MTKHYSKPFSEHGNWTPVHNVVFDVIMPNVSANAFKILCFILRETKGKQESEQDLSYGDIKRGTGIKNDSTVSNGVKELLCGGKNGYIRCTTPTEKWAKSRYRINENFVYSPDDSLAPIIGATPKNGAEKTPAPKIEAATENGAVPTPKNGGIPLQKMESTKEKDIECKSTKECVHTHAHEDPDSSSNSSSKTPERDERIDREKRLMAAIIEGFGKTIQYKMGRTSDRFNRGSLKAAQILADDGHDAHHVTDFFVKFPQWMSQRTGKPVDSVTKPTYDQLTDDFAEVLKFDPNAKKEAPREQHTAKDRHERNRDRAFEQLSVAAALRNRLRDMGNAAANECPLP